jgi:hypothetical protein
MMYRQNPNTCAAELDGEICLFDPSKAKYLNLNGSGSAIWHLLAEPIDKGAIVAELLERYEVEEATCQSEVEAFLKDATEQGLVLQESV